LVESNVNSSGLQATRQLVLIASTMRSGSTLLKALLAFAPDVSDLNEVNFQKYAGANPRLDQMWELAPQRILVLKRPAWYHETKTYPRLPGLANRRVILLVRDVYPTVESLRRMSLGWLAGASRQRLDRWLAQAYWKPVTERLLALSRQSPEQMRLVRYEDLVERPQQKTLELFRFIGSVQSVGTDTYSVPARGRWRWGIDDNSPKIRSLRVQPPKSGAITNPQFAEWIEQDPALQKLRGELGYCSGRSS
jgi:hypothetical protein